MGSDSPPVYPSELSKRIFDLGPAQMAVWISEYLTRKTPKNHLSRVFSLEGELRLSALQQAVDSVITQHDMLRMSLTSENGSPRQVVQPLSVPVQCSIAVSAVQPQCPSGWIEAFLTEEIRRSFDLGVAPLLRVGLLSDSPRKHFLLIVCHRLVADEYSLDLICREIGLFYGPGLPTSQQILFFEDFLSEQRVWLSSPAATAQREYWRLKLSGCILAPELPFDRPRPAEPTFAGAAHHFVLDETVAKSVRALAEKEKVSPAVLFLAAFMAFLYRHTGQSDIAVGSRLPARRRPGMDNLCGLVENLVVLRVGCRPEDSFTELLGRVQETLLGALANQDLPFETYANELPQERDVRRAPLVPVMFRYDDRRQGVPSYAGIKVQAHASGSAFMECDLSLHLEDLGAIIGGYFTYGAELFEPATVGRMAAHYSLLVEAAVAEPGRPVARLPVMTAEERKKVLVDWNSTTTAFPHDDTIHRLFEAQAARTPERVCLVFGATEWCYRELDERANALARHLMKRGVMRGTMIGICALRSPELIVGILAILKAGGAFVPLDPAYPRERLELMLDDTRTPLLLTQRSLVGALSTCPSGGLVLLDEPLADQSDQRIGRPDGGATADDLAYIMYTSGSTGRPKGVMVGHRAVVRLVRNTNFADFGEDQVFLLLAPISFDASTLEIWGPLLNGGRLVIMPPDPPSLEQIGSAISRHGVTTLWLTSGLFNAMVEHRLDDLRPLRQLLAGGDVLSTAHVRRVLDELPDCRLINGYGPTENTTFTCCHTVTRQDLDLGSIPIGRPISNTQVYLLDAQQEPVPMGVAGELYTGGAGLSRGYLNQPELTAGKFVPDPFHPGERLYRTGDWARYLPDGSIQFLRRLDNQVKIRGFRIELGEIDAALLRHPAVKDAAVVAREDIPGDKRLVAYVVTDLQQVPEMAVLQDYLQEILPGYMVPAMIVPVEALPLNANGKVDRGLLASDSSYLPRPGGTSTPPLSAMELTLSGIWQEVVGITGIGRHDNFFDLGTHSLHMVAIHDKLEKQLKKSLPITALFQYPSVSALARYLSGGGAEVGSDAVRIRAERQHEALARQRQIRRGGGR